MEWGKREAHICMDWNRIAIPKKWGGWGLKDLPSFAQALAAKMGWTLITGDNLWTHMKINDGTQARIGSDPWNGSGGRHILPEALIRFLHTQGITYIADIADPQRTTIFEQRWKTVDQINIPPLWHQECLSYINALFEAHIRIKQGPDELIWYPVQHGIYTPKSGYLSLISHKVPDLISFWWNSIWKLTSPPWQKLFFWCILKGVVPTGEYFMRRAVHGPSWCILCKKSAESCTHLFLQCSILTHIWQAISSDIQYSGKWEGVDINQTWETWFNQHMNTKLQSLPIITCWYLWLARNRLTFEDKPVHWPHITAKII
eukprot:PITA_15641